MAINYQQLKHRHFPAIVCKYDAGLAAKIARGFGAGLTPQLAADDAPYLAGQTMLPMAAIALADGEFWQQRPDTGIDWRRIVHAEEAITIHAALPSQGTVIVTQHVEEIFDRGPERGAVMLQKQFLNATDGTPLVTIDVTTILKGDGGFGGKPYVPLKTAIPEDRAADAVIELRSPANDEHAAYRLSAGLSITDDLPPGKAMMRGLGCFGLAGRAVLKLVCNNDVRRLRKMAVRYAGAMLTDETMRIELWNVDAGVAVFRMRAIERDALILNNCCVEFDV